MSDLKVSIIVPVYNVEKYLNKCVDSLINQTYKNLEIILVDDGSTDFSCKICDQYKLQDSRIVVIHNKNGGLSSARNAGLDIMTGEYVMFIDSDDYIALDAVEDLINLLKQNSDKNIDIIQYKYIEIDEHYKEAKLQRMDKVLYIDDTKKYYEMLYKIGGEAASACSKLYKTSVFDNLRYKDGILHEDEYMATHMLCNIKGILYSENIYYFYVFRNGSIIKSKFKPKKMDLFYVIEDRLQFLKYNEYYDLLEIQYAKYFMSLILIYCDAKNNGFNDESKIIISKLSALLKDTKLTLVGKYKILYCMLKVNINAIEIFRVLKSLRGRIK